MRFNTTSKTGVGKQMFTLAVRSGKLMTKPHIEMLKESNARQGVFEPDQMAEVLARLPADLHRTRPRSCRG